MVDIIRNIISQKTFIKLPLTDVYKAITSPDCWNTFFTTGLEIDLKEGGEMFFRWKDWGPDFYTTEVACTVVACNKPSKFAFEWGEKIKSIVEFNLTSEFGGTVILLKEFGYPNSDDGIKNMLDCASGWGEALTLLKF